MDDLRRSLLETKVDGDRTALANLLLHAPDLVADWLFEVVVLHCGDEVLVQKLGKHPDVSPAKLERLLDLAGRLAPRPAVLAALARSPRAPASMRDHLATVGDVHTRRALAGNPTTPAALLDRLARDAEGYVREAVAGNPSAAPATLLHLIAADGAAPHREAIAKNPACPAEGIARLACDRDPDVRRAARAHPRAPAAAECDRLLDATEHGRRLARAGDPRAPLDLLLLLAMDGDPDVRAAATTNPAFTPPETLLEEQAQSPEPARRELVARFARTPVALLERLARDPDETVRAGVAQNPGAPPTLLLQLADDDSGRVGAALARREGAPPDLLARLAQHPDGWVKRWVAENPRTPAAALEALARDRAAANAVAQNPAAPASALQAIAAGENPVACLVLAKRDDLPWPVVERLIRHRSSVIREKLARPELPLPEGALANCALSPEIADRRFAALHPDTPVPTLERLARDPVAEVRWDVTDNPRTPRSLVERIRIAFVITCGEEAGMLGRAIALACPQTPYSADLEKAALAGSWIERYALAGRADISRMAWGVIARDENGLVKGVRRG